VGWWDGCGRGRNPANANAFTSPNGWTFTGSSDRVDRRRPFAVPHDRHGRASIFATTRLGRFLGGARTPSRSARKRFRTKPSFRFACGNFRRDTFHLVERRRGHCKSANEDRPFRIRISLWSSSHGGNGRFRYGYCVWVPYGADSGQQRRSRRSSESMASQCIRYADIRQSRSCNVIGQSLVDSRWTVCGTARFNLSAFW
jgi:hypothetical protein